MSDLRQHPLVVCLQILEQMGLPGQWVWKNGEHIEDMRERVRYLKQAIAWLRTTSQDPQYTLPPVDFRTFCESEDLMNKRGILWPGVLAEGAEINSGKYTEVVLTGGIGVAKATLAIYSQAYQLYSMSLMAEPHKVFDLDPSSEILTVFQSLNKNLAQDVDYRRFRDMIDGSPYFGQHFPFDTEREKEMRFPRNFVVKPVAGHDTAAIGQNVIGGIIDEVNFMAIVEKSKQTRDGSVYDQATQNYNAIARRRESRFMQLGRLPGLLCLVSSRNYPGQFTDKKEEEAKTNPRIYVYDKRIWEIRPERFRGDWFRVFIGDPLRKPRILSPDDVVTEEDARLVMRVPDEYRATFDADLLAALRDVAGVATQALHPFMLNIDAIAACFGKVPSIASRDRCDFLETRLQLLPRRIQHREQPRFAHLDLAVTKDNAGVSVGHVPEFRKVIRGDAFEMLPVVQFDMILEVAPPKAGEIEFDRIRRILYALRDRLGINLKWVTCDDYQSRDNMQILSRAGFMVGYQSMDVDTYAFDVAKQAFYDDRVRAPAHDKAVRELTTLEFDPKHNKVDHPPHGSKDVADSVAGVIIGLTMRREVWNAHGVSTRQMPQALAAKESTSKRSLSYTERLREARGVQVQRAS